MRDGDAKKELQTLDTMTLSFTDLVNENHRAAYGTNGKTGHDCRVDPASILQYCEQNGAVWNDDGGDL